MLRCTKVELYNFEGLLAREDVIEFCIGDAFVTEVSSLLAILEGLIDILDDRFVHYL